MRWIAVVTATVLMMCTVFSCTGLAAEHAHARQTQAPPCHQHQKPAAPQSGNPCDHQQAVTTDHMGIFVPDMAWMPVAVAAPPLTVSLTRPEPWAPAEGPPALAIPISVLRI